MGPKTKFLISNLTKGMLWLAIFIVGYILFRKFVKLDFLVWLEPVYGNTILVFLIYAASEIIIGIIPPEIFFIWATRVESFELFIFYAFLLAILSYLAGFLAYWFGKKLNTTSLFRYLNRRYLSRYVPYLNTYGPFLIIVAAMTPIPYSGTAMLMGSMKYPFKRYMIYASSRFIRYAIYTGIFWELARLENAGSSYFLIQ